MINLEIQSNIKGVLGRLQRFEAGLPDAVARAFVPSDWLPVLKRHAAAVLHELATDDERPFIPMFLATVLAQVFGSPGFQVSMSAPRADDPIMAKALGAARRITTREYGGVTRRRREPLQPSEDESELFASVDEAIRAWVTAPFTGRDDPASGKELTGDDVSLTTEDLVARIRTILFDPDVKDDQARDGLARRIQEFIEAQTAGGLDRDTVSLWLRAVLAGWKDVVTDQLPLKVRQEIRTLRRRIGEELF